MDLTDGIVAVEVAVHVELLTIPETRLRQVPAIGATDAVRRSRFAGDRSFRRVGCGCGEREHGTDSRSDSAEPRGSGGRDVEASYTWWARPSPVGAEQ